VRANRSEAVRDGNDGKKLFGGSGEKVVEGGSLLLETGGEVR
jgi:hypothetical protein